MSAPVSRPTYAAVLRVPYARRAFAAALSGRLAYGLVSLSLLLATVRATGSYAVAGTVLALFGASAVLLMPLRASLVDRHGPRRALPPMTALYAVLLGALAAATWSPGAQPVVIGALAALAGACAPPSGPSCGWCGPISSNTGGWCSGRTASTGSPKNAGGSLGSAASGLLLGHAPLAVCFPAAGALALVTAAVAVAGAERVR